MDISSFLSGVTTNITSKTEPRTLKQVHIAQVFNDLANLTKDSVDDLELSVSGITDQILILSGLTSGGTVDLSSYYTKDEVNDIVLSGSGVDLSNYYTKTQSDNKFLTGYTLTKTGITTALGYTPLSAQTDYTTLINTSYVNSTGYTDSQVTILKSGSTSSGNTLGKLETRILTVETGITSNYYTKSQTNSLFLTAITSSQIVSGLGYTPLSAQTDYSTSITNSFSDSTGYTNTQINIIKSGSTSSGNTLGKLETRIITLESLSGGSTDLTNYYTKTQSDDKFLTSAYTGFDSRYLTGYTLFASAITASLGYVPLSAQTDYSSLINTSYSNSTGYTATQINLVKSGSTTSGDTLGKLETRISTIELSGNSYLTKSGNLSGLTDISAARTNLGLGTLATQSGTFSGSSTGTNTGDETQATIKSKLGTASTISDGYVTSTDYSNFYNNVLNTSSNKKIGAIYSKSTWSDLNDFETNGGYSISGGYIQTPSSAGGTAYIRLPNPTMLDQNKISMIVKYKGAGDTGIKIGFQSSNTTIAASTYGYCSFNSGSLGKAVIEDVYTSTSYTSSTGVSLTINDLVLVEFSINRNIVSCTVTNITQRTSVNVSFTNTFTYGASSVGRNTGKVAILTAAATSHEIQQIKFESDQQYKPKNLFVGDSLTFGSNAEAWYNRFPELLKGSISAGGGDKTAEILSRTYEIINIIKPQNVYLMAGINDLFQSVSTGTWQSNYQTIVSTLEAAGITVYKIATPASNGTNTSVILSFLQSTYPTSYIDAYTPFWSGSGSGLNSTYNSGDGTHINKSGNTLLANTIIRSGLFNGYFDISYSDAEEASLLALKQDIITITTTGTSGAATFAANILNIPQYSGGTGSSQWTTTGSNIYYATGNVGIGVTSPSQLLHLKTTAPAIRFENTGLTQTYDFGPFNNATGGFALQRNDTANINTFAFLSPKGTGFNFDTKNITAGLAIYGTDVIASATNSESLVIEAWNTNGYGIYNAKSGSGSARSITLDATAAASRANLKQLYLATSGNIGLGTTSPTGVLHLKAGTSTSNTAPLKYTSGTSLTTPEAGAHEYDGTKFYCTNSSAVRREIVVASPIIISTASTLTLDYATDYVFNGSTATYTLPAISSILTGRAWHITIKNRGTGSITLNSDAGSTIYSSSAVGTYTINAGDAVTLLPDGTYFNII